ncbi:MAG: glycoside hydrolase family 32 protein [Oscillospiraceae bacterium]|nr:glycoside hydrolase family 32 protein [Oscillospiraceae bacterium]
MNVKIEHKYLVFPINSRATYKELTFSDGKGLDYHVMVQLDNIDPNDHCYIDVSRFMGKDTSITVEPQMPFTFRTADEIDLPNVYHETYRPQVHFTAKYGWINDPNGMIYYNGEYHLFYQHNPAGLDMHRENCHWGHAVSKDMIHWEQKDIMLYPDERHSMYSGSAIVDEKNLLGKQVGDNKTVVLFHTTNRDPYWQNIAYSTDGLKTSVPYENNPVVDHIEGRNRDPKVTFCEELGAYIMTFFLAGDRFQILRSDDLVHWEKVQVLSVPESIECPDFFPLTTPDGERKWVFVAGNDAYVVGDWVNGQFVPCQKTKMLHYGKSAYAGQSFNNAPNGRVVRMAWGRWFLSTDRFDGQMTIPMEMGLMKKDGEYYLTAKIVEELNVLFDETKREENLSCQKGKIVTIPLKDSANLIRFKGKFPQNGSVRVTVFGRPFRINFAENAVTMTGNRLPISAERDEVDITLLVDRCSFEFFADKGRGYISDSTAHTILDRNLCYMTLEAEEDYTFSSVEVTSLKSIWE